MYPREHAVVSGAAVLLAGGYTGLGVERLALWVVVGTVAGVFIDADHVPLAMVFNGKMGEGLYWFRHPLRAILKPRELHDSIDPGDEIIAHRLVSHLMIFLGLLLFLPYNPLVLPVLIGVAAHIAADVAWDFHVQDGFPYI